MLRPLSVALISMRLDAGYHDLYVLRITYDSSVLLYRAQCDWYARMDSGRLVRNIKLSGSYLGMSCDAGMRGDLPKRTASPDR